MANEYAVNKADLTVVADAIRTRGETSDSLVFPDEYVTAIEAIKGGGEELNFSVVAYASEDAIPATADENTIAVITTTPITGYLFSADVPANPIEGHLWIATATDSQNQFNALKGNTLMVYLVRVQQYIGGVWIDKDAKIYQDGAWVAFLLCNIYANGEIGFPYTVAEGTLANSSGKLVLDDPYAGSSTAFIEVIFTGVDFTNYSRLEVTYTNQTGTEGTIRIGDTTDWVNGSITSLTMAGTSGTRSVDVSEITGVQKVRVALYSETTGVHIEIERLRLVA